MSDSPERTATVRVDYGLILLLSGPDGVTPSSQELQESNGLILVTPGGAALITGIDSGSVELTVEAVDGEPGVDMTEWEEMADVSIDASVGDLRVVSVLGDAELPALSFDGPGVYRVRCLATSRGQQPAGVEIESPERYRLIVWKAPAAPAVTRQVLANRYRS